MLQFIRLTALVSIVYGSFVAVEKFAPSAALGTADLQPEQRVCVAQTPLQEAIHAVDYAEAVLVANGEMYTGLSSVEVRDLIADLPRYDESDGLSFKEVVALHQLLKYGRQLAYAIATEDLKARIQSAPEGIQIASAGEEINFEMLEALRGC